jgi:hypothetical protein
MHGKVLRLRHCLSRTSTSFGIKPRLLWKAHPNFIVVAVGGTAASVSIRSRTLRPAADPIRRHGGHDTAPSVTAHRNIAAHIAHRDLHRVGRGADVEAAVFPSAFNKPSWSPVCKVLIL